LTLLRERGRLGHASDYRKSWMVYTQAKICNRRRGEGLRIHRYKHEIKFSHTAINICILK
jgi:hypothetical protein